MMSQGDSSKERLKSIKESLMKETVNFVLLPKIYFSAIQLAELSGVRPKDIRYWGRQGHIAHRSKGTKTPYPFTSIEKARLMGKLLKSSNDLTARRASRIADELIKAKKKNVEVYENAVYAMLVFEERLALIGELLSETDFRKILQEEGL